MNKILSILAGIAMAVSVISPSFAEDKPKAVDLPGASLETILNSTYKLRTGEDDNCSAQAVSQTQLLTAFHCVDMKLEKEAITSTYSIVVEKKDDKKNVVSKSILYVKVLRGIKAKDTAMLELVDPDYVLPAFVPIASEEDGKALKTGQSLIAVGYPMVVDLTVTDGLFTGLVKAPPGLDGMDTLFYKTTVPVTGGSSGGGLYLQTGLNKDVLPEYKLIGTTTGGYQHVDFMTYFTPVTSLIEVTKSLLTFKSSDAKVETKEEKKEEVKKESVEPGKVLINPSDER